MPDVMHRTFLLDTNVLSELRKRERCHPKVRDWFDQIPDENVYTSVLVMGEIRRGIESLRLRDPVTANHLGLWLGGLEQDFTNRILPVNAQIADVWGHLNASTPLPVIDSLLAATALVHGFILATRNVEDIRRTGVRWFNPFNWDSSAQDG
jgi:predicted nucleic acid-binding protein